MRESDLAGAAESPAAERMTGGYFFLTDGPPLRENAFGNHAIAATLIEAMGHEFKLVISRRLWRRVRWQEVQSASSVPVFLYPDTALIGLRRISRGLSEIVDLLGAWSATQRIRRLARSRKPGRFFALAGGNGWFLIVVWMMARATRLPFVIYLVDDLEDSAVLWRQRILRRIIRTLERGVLARAERVFCISKGYAEHIEAKYGLPALWLPLPIAASNIVYRPYQAVSPDTRRIVFVGSGITALYLTALIDCYLAIRARNARCNNYRLVLCVITIAGAQPLVERLPDTEDLETFVRPSRAELRRHCHESWATFLPYSFDLAVRKLVSTSFSSKLADSFAAGRPILVYGPAEASIPRYFREAALPLCATSKEDLPSALDAIAEHDTPELIREYGAIWNNLHSPAAIRARITGELST